MLYFPKLGHVHKKKPVWIKTILWTNTIAIAAATVATVTVVVPRPGWLRK